MPDLEHDSAPELVKQLRDEAQRLSGHSIDRGCVDSGLAANLADAAADAIERLSESQSSEPSSSEPVAIKRMEWEPVLGEYVETYQATCATGIYRVFADEDSAAGAVVVEFAVDVSRFCMTDALSIGRFHDFDTAKAAAQADYEQRIRSALSPTASQPVTGEEVVASELVRTLRGFEQAYSEKIFRPLSEAERREIGPMLLSRASADMGRHLAKFFTQAANALEAAEARLSAVEGALKEAAPYVEQAVKDDGGIDNCEIGDRIALERIREALTTITGGENER